MRILIAQAVPTPGDLAVNTTVIEEALDTHPGVDIAIFPELFLPGYFAGQEPRFAVRPDDEPMTRIARAARRNSTGVVFGYAEGHETGISNSVAYVNAVGELVAVYRKAQLFGSGESDAFVPGNVLTTTEVRGVTVGLLNCFDVEFPEHARALALAGADVLITVAANMAPYGPDHALAVRARAVENRRVHIYVNRVGTEDDLHFVGESCVVLPTGEFAERLGNDPRFAEVDIDFQQWQDSDVEYLNYVRKLPVTHE